MHLRLPCASLCSVVCIICTQSHAVGNRRLRSPGVGCRERSTKPLMSLALAMLAYAPLSPLCHNRAKSLQRSSSRLSLLDSDTSVETEAQNVPDLLIDQIQVYTLKSVPQLLPLGYVSTWPIFVAAPDGSSVTQLPDSDVEGGWLNPHAFEQLWLPLDLPAPTCRAALGVVLKDAAPRYLFPTMETVVMRKDTLWHNRGLNSIPLASTWIPFDGFQLDDLRISAFSQKFVGRVPKDEKADSTKSDGAKEVQSEDAMEAWTPLLSLVPVQDAIEIMFKVIADAPDEMGSGFTFLLIPLLDDSARLPPAETNMRTRFFLSDRDDMPKLLKNQEPEYSEWYGGECDIRSYAIAAGGESEYMPEAYKPLYQDDKATLADRLSDIVS